MVTGELKQKLDALWESFWTGGITNPLSVIEQITYLLFIKGLDDLQIQKEKDANTFNIKLENPVFGPNQQHLRWSNFKHKSPEEMYEIVSKEVFPFIKNLQRGQDTAYSKFMGEDAIFLIPTPRLLVRAVEAIDQLNMKDRDTKGDIYEYLLSKIQTSGTNGQFRTPIHIVRMMVELMEPNLDDLIIDPAMGTAGFLVECAKYVKMHYRQELYKKSHKEHFERVMFTGNELDRTMLRIGAMNMILHDVPYPNIRYLDSLSSNNDEREKYTLVLANPPFTGSLDYDIVSSDLLAVAKTKKTELLFLALFIRLLQPGGRGAVIVPDGVLFGASKAHLDIRKELVENQRLQAVISMPSGVFKPYAGVSTAILIFTKTNSGGTDYVWFYDMKADGYSLDDKREPIEANDIPDIIRRYKNLEEEKKRTRKDQSFLVSKDEIVKNGYDLSINRYKEIEFDEIKYEHPRVLLEKIKNIEQKILIETDELDNMLGDFKI